MHLLLFPLPTSSTTYVPGSRKWLSSCETRVHVVSPQVAV